MAILARIFDKNYDGYIDKDEFRWMTTSDIISNKTIKTVFEVSLRTSPVAVSPTNTLSEV